MDDVFVCFRISLLVLDVPSEMFKKRVNKLASDLGLLVLAGFVRLKVLFEAVD